MRRALVNLACLFGSMVVTIALGVLWASPAHAAEPSAIEWAPSSPHQACAAAGLEAVLYGYPTTYRCNGGQPAVTTPACPEGSYVDFAKLLCVPNSSAVEQLAGMPVDDAVSLAWQLVLLLAIGWGVRLTIQALKGDSNYEEPV